MMRINGEWIPVIMKHMNLLEPLKIRNKTGVDSTDSPHMTSQNTNMTKIQDLVTLMVIHLGQPCTIPQCRPSYHWVHPLEHLMRCHSMVMTHILGTWNKCIIPINFGAQNGVVGIPESMLINHNMDQCLAIHPIPFTWQWIGSIPCGVGCMAKH